MKIKHNSTIKEQRKKRVRGKIFGTAKRPRLSVLRTNKHIYLQIINDDKGITLSSVGSVGKNSLKGTKTEKVQVVASQLAAVLKKKKIKCLVFDRSYYKFHGRVKEAASTLKKYGIEL